MQIGEHIRKLRKMNHISLRELADSTGLSVSFLSDIEHQRSEPSLASLELIAKGFGLGAGDMLVDAGYTVRPSGHPDPAALARQALERALKILGY